MREYPTAHTTDADDAPEAHAILAALWAGEFETVQPGDASMEGVSPDDVALGRVRRAILDTDVGPWLAVAIRDAEGAMSCTLWLQGSDATVRYEWAAPRRFLD